jgi:peptidyl-prolyl cis-trans isomerase C
MENKVLAVVNGRNITQQDLNMLMQGLGQQGAMQFSSPEGQKRLLEELVNQELFYADAVDNGMDNEEAFKAELEQMKINALKQYYMRNLLADVKVEDEEAVNYYNEHTEMFKKPESVKASHILVDDEEKAKEVLAEI